MLFLFNEFRNETLPGISELRSCPVMVSEDTGAVNMEEAARGCVVSDDGGVESHREGSLAPGPGSDTDCAEDDFIAGRGAS